MKNHKSSDTSSLSRKKSKDDAPITIELCDLMTGIPHLTVKSYLMPRPGDTVHYLLEDWYELRIHWKPMERRKKPRKS